jgi:hypothetical protein
MDTYQPLLQFDVDAPAKLEHLWQVHNYDALERTIGYKFKQRAYLIQACTHASYYKHRVTDCYQVGRGSHLEHNLRTCAAARVPWRRRSRLSHHSASVQ